MTIWMLFVIFLEADRYYVVQNGVFQTMESCFAAREVFMLTAPQPKINYEAVCISTNKVELQ